MIAKGFTGEPYSMFFHVWPWIGLGAAIVLLLLIFCTDFLRSDKTKSRFRDPVSLAWMGAVIYMLHNLEEYGVDMYGNQQAFTTLMYQLLGVRIGETAFLCCNLLLVWVVGPLTAVMVKKGYHSEKPSLAPEQWHSIFKEAAELGVSFCLLAGGEPLMRRDLLECAAEVEDIIFPVFTNGTLIGATYTEFFKNHLNMVPVISLEGELAATDDRRGNGVFQRALRSMEMLQKEKLFFGTSITVTTENYHDVTSEAFLSHLVSLGCRLVFYVEYVPFDESTSHLAFRDEHVAEMEQIVELRRERFKEMIFLSFPGDEKAVDGCMAAGRGFFHIGPDGAAEPCPFSPFSDSNVAQIGLRQALQSPLFRRIRDARALGWEHTGGCTLYEHREEIEKMALT
jgi:MoaA/NifB/PqqE/SkfB family radical SAM enzyme